MRRIRTSAAATIVGLGALVLLAPPSFAVGDHTATRTQAPVQLAHMGQGQAGQRTDRPCPMGEMGSGMMQPGWDGHSMMAPGMGGYGMMAPGGYGHGMMQPGGDGQGMMGQGLGKGLGFGSRVVPDRDLTVDDVRHFLEHRLEMHGNKRIKVGEVKEADKDKLVADITTIDGSLVQRLEVDRHTGDMKHVE